MNIERKHSAELVDLNRENTVVLNGYCDIPTLNLQIPYILSGCRIPIIGMTDESMSLLRKTDITTYLVVKSAVTETSFKLNKIAKAAENKMLKEAEELAVFISSTLSKSSINIVG
jgi:hypothetical protein